MDKLQLEDGSYRRIVGPDEVTEVVSLFHALDPFGDGEPFFEVEAEGTAAIFGPKKYGIVDEAGNVVAHTESGIGAFAPPPGFAARGSDGRLGVGRRFHGSGPRLLERGDRRDPLPGFACGDACRTEDDTGGLADGRDVRRRFRNDPNHVLLLGTSGGGRIGHARKRLQHARHRLAQRTQRPGPAHGPRGH